VKRAPPDIERDPFHERGERVWTWSTRVLGARVEFSGNSRELLDVAREAFAGVPAHRWPGAGRMTLRITLRHRRENARPAWRMPPKAVLSSGAGVVCGHIDSSNFMIVNMAEDSALIQVGNAMLRHRQLLRYELVEFAAITLATRAQGLVPLHAGCVGAHGRGVLLLGASGTGKSTLTLHAALGGLEFLAEDSVFVQPATMRASGLSAFTHAREDSLGLIADRQVQRAARHAPCIERRSGVRKREIDLRQAAVRLAPKPLRIVATVVLSTRSARGAVNLLPLTARQLKRELRAEQAYAAGRPGWHEFERRVLRAGGYRLLRSPPADGVSSLRDLLSGKRA
jgi:hypothetical protein